MTSPLFYHVEKCFDDRSMNGWHNLLQTLEPLDFSQKENLLVLSYALKKAKDYPFWRIHNSHKASYRITNHYLYLLCHEIQIDYFVPNTYLKNLLSISVIDSFDALMQAEFSNLPEILVVRLISSAPYSVTFRNNPNLTSVEIEDTDLLEDLIFEDCPNLRTIHLKTCSALQILQIKGEIPHFKMLHTKYCRKPLSLPPQVGGKVCNLEPLEVA